jgi:hypothetical protein
MPNELRPYQIDVIRWYANEQAGRDIPIFYSCFVAGTSEEDAKAKVRPQLIHAFERSFVREEMVATEINIPGFRITLTPQPISSNPLSRFRFNDELNP